MLVCSAYGGIPDEYNITLRQQGVSVSGSSLQIPLNRFGEYVCTVDSLYNTTTVRISIQEKGEQNDYASVSACDIAKFWVYIGPI